MTGPFSRPTGPGPGDDPHVDVRVRPLPVSVGLSLLDGARVGAPWLALGLVGTLLVMLSLAGMAALRPEFDGGEGDLLARSMAGGLLAAPLPILLLAALTTVADVAARRRIAERTADGFRPLAAERRDLAFSPASRTQTYALIGGFFLGVTTLVCYGVGFMGDGELWYWIPALVGTAVTIPMFLIRWALRGARERAGDRWNAIRARWPRDRVRPRAEGRSEDDRGTRFQKILAPFEALTGIAAVGMGLWGLWQMDSDEFDPDAALTPFHGAAIFAALCVALVLLSSAVGLVRRVGRYRAFDRDPSGTAARRVEAGHAPTPTTAAARELLRPHPLHGPALVLAALGASALIVATTPLYLPITGEEYTGTIAQKLPLLALPGAGLVLLAWVLLARESSANARHRLRIVAAHPCDPVPARRKVSDSDGGSYHVPVYGNAAGDPKDVEKLTDDDPR